MEFGTNNDQWLVANSVVASALLNLCAAHTNSDAGGKDSAGVATLIMAARGAGMVFGRTTSVVTWPPAFYVGIAAVCRTLTELAERPDPPSGVLQHEVPAMLAQIAGEAMEVVGLLRKDADFQYRERKKNRHLSREDRTAIKNALGVIHNRAARLNQTVSRLRLAAVPKDACGTA